MGNARLAEEHIKENMQKEHNAAHEILMKRLQSRKVQSRAAFSIPRKSHIEIEKLPLSSRLRLEKAMKSDNEDDQMNGSDGDATIDSDAFHPNAVDTDTDTDTDADANAIETSQVVTDVHTSENITTNVTGFNRPARRTTSKKSRKVKTKITGASEIATDSTKAKITREDMEKKAKQAEMRLQVEQERVRSDARTRLQEKLRLKRLGLTSEVVDDFLASSDEDVDVTAYKPLTDFNLDDLLSASDSDNDGVGDGVGDGSSDGNKGQDELREKAKIEERIVSPGVDTNISSDDDDNDVVATVANIRMTVMKRRKKKNPNSKQRKTLKRAASRRFPKNELGEDESRGAE